MEDFISSYISYTSDTEVPAIFSRWAAITGLGAYLGRAYYLDHGHFNIHSNIYCMLIGSPGTRKGTAIKLMKKLLEQAGYTKFAAERTSKEKFLLDLAGGSSDGLLDPDELLDQNIFGTSASGRPDCEMFIAIDEFNDFIGNGNIEFISMLGNMWDYNGIYKNRIKTGKSVEISNPTISIIGGNTPTGFSLAFPTDILGQGFFSRLMLIYGEPNGKRIAFPKSPSPSDTKRMLEKFTEIRTRCQGPASISNGAEKLFEKIYVGGFGVHDVRFESYSNRRFSHLLKLALIVSAARISTSITEADIVYANTILCHTERFMPKALGEFGKAKHSDVSHKIIQLLQATPRVLKFKEIWAEVGNDLDDMPKLATLLQNLTAAEKIQQVPGGKGFLIKRTTIEQIVSELYNPSLLTQEERDMSV